MEVSSITNTIHIDPQRINMAIVQNFRPLKSTSVAAIWIISIWICQEYSDMGRFTLPPHEIADFTRSLRNPVKEYKIKSLIKALVEENIILQQDFPTEDEKVYEFSVWFLGQLHKVELEFNWQYQGKFMEYDWPRFVVNSLGERIGSNV